MYPFAEKAPLQRGLLLCAGQVPAAGYGTTFSSAPSSGRPDIDCTVLSNRGLGTPNF